MKQSLESNPQPQHNAPTSNQQPQHKPLPTPQQNNSNTNNSPCSKLNQMQNKKIKYCNYHFCQLIDGQSLPIPIHQVSGSGLGTNGYQFYNRRRKYNKNIVSNQKKFSQITSKQINLITNNRATTAVLKQKINNNTIFQQQMLGRKTCKIYYPSKKQISIYKINDNKLQDSIESPTQDNNQKIQNIPLKNKSYKTKKNYQRTKERATKKSSSAFEDDSVQYIQDTMPGPGYYNIAQKYKEPNMSKNISTFGMQQRFTNIRPVTAIISYPNVQSSLLRPQKDNNLDHVAFNTSKAIPRSEIKKIQYCQWNRPHFYQSLQNTKRKNSRQDPIYASTLQRFKDPIKNYNGPDFYNKQSKTNTKIIKNGLPSHYFVSEVPKGFQFPPEDQRDFYDIQTKKETKKIRKKIRGKQNKQKVTSQQHQVQIKQRRKNSLNTKYKKPNKKNNPKKQQKLNQQSQQQKSWQKKIQNIVLKQKIKIYSRKQCQFQKDKWIKPSYNVKFQSTPTLFRL